MERDVQSLQDDQDVQFVAQAVERGYFDVPRRVTLSELDEESDHSDVAASKQIRRGVVKIVDDAVAD